MVVVFQYRIVNKNTYYSYEYSVGIWIPVLMVTVCPFVKWFLIEMASEILNSKQKVQFSDFLGPVWNSIWILDQKILKTRL